MRFVDSEIAFRDHLVPVDYQNSLLIEKNVAKITTTKQTPYISAREQSYPLKTLFKERNDDDPEFVNFPKVSMR